MNKVFLCSLDYPGTLSVDQPGLKLETLIPLPPEHQDQRHAQPYNHYPEPKITFLKIFCVESSRQGFSVALEPALDLALIDQAGFKLIEIHLSLPPECWV